MSTSASKAGRAWRFSIALVVSATAVIAGGYFFWHRLPRRDPFNPLGLLNVAPEVQYVGDEECAQCHQSIAKSYERTAMGRSWRTPQQAEPIEDYSGVTEVGETSDGYHYQVYQEDGKFYQREYRLDEDGE